MIYSIADFSIEYDRSAKTWNLSNGHPIKAYPAGKDNKRRAVAHALKLAEPEIYDAMIRIIEKHPALTSRAINAALLVHFGHVRRYQDPVDFQEMGIEIAEVLSQRPASDSYIPRLYYPRITPDRRTWCNCDDHAEAPEIATGRMCKHWLAFMIAERAQRDHLKWNQKKGGFTGQHRGRTATSIYTESPNRQKLFTV